MSKEAIANGTILGTDVPAVVQKLFQAVKPTATPTSVEDAISKAAAAWGINNAAATPAPSKNILQNVLTLVLEGFTSSDIQVVAAGAVRNLPRNLLNTTNQSRVHSQTPL